MIGSTGSALADWRSGPVIDDLEGLLYALELVDDQWRHEFIEGWSALEIAYAVALDRNEPLPTIGDEDVAESVDRLDLLVRSKLAAPGT